MISTVERVLFLKGVDFFTEIPSELLVSVARLAVEERFDTGAVVLREGDEGDCLYLVVEGRVAVVFEGREVAHLGPKECIGEMSLLDAEPRSATVVASDPTLCLRVDREPFHDLLAEHPELARGLISVLSRRLRTMLRDQRQTLV
ncbi:MAG TPA: cyclic nucleotide-binding domain-containing protein [Polyangiaceae bacterium]|nr:cyclic nucleotide-binding domain-containing protein [Polyangiaceae bacterium]